MSSSPKAFLVGFPRCGSTFLANVLIQHPHVFIPPEKEVNYFNKTFRYFGHPKIPSLDSKKSIGSYLEHYEENLFGMDFSILTAYDPTAAERMREVLGDIKIIVLVRDREHQKKSFYNILKLNGDIRDISYESYLKKYGKLADYYSDFETHIKTFEKHFSNVFVGNIIENDEKEEVKKIVEFLELPKFKFNYQVFRNQRWGDKIKSYQFLRRKISIFFPRVYPFLKKIFRNNKKSGGKKIYFNKMNSGKEFKQQL